MSYKPRFYDSFLCITLTPVHRKHLEELLRRNPTSSRNAIIRALIKADITETIILKKGVAGNILLRTYRKKSGKRLRTEDTRLRIRVTQEMRTLAKMRAWALSFTITEYVTALLERSRFKDSSMARN